MSARSRDRVSSFNPLPSTALCQLLIVDRIFAPLSSPFFLRKGTTAGDISRSQSGTDCLFLPVTDSYARPVFGSCNASLKSLMSIPGIEPSRRQFINHLSTWLWSSQWVYVLMGLIVSFWLIKVRGKVGWVIW